MKNTLFHSLIDLEMAVPWLVRRCRLPGPVRNLFAAELRDRRLLLRWETARGGSPASVYRIERTREGRAYELLAEIIHLQITLPAPALREPWFYRVTAENERGIGRAKWVYFFMRRSPAQRGSILQLVPADSRLTVNICEMVPKRVNSIDAQNCRKRTQRAQRK